LFSARRQAQGLVVLSPSLPTWQWTVWVKSKGRQNGLDLKAKCPCRQNGLSALLGHRYKTASHLSRTGSFRSTKPTAVGGLMCHETENLDKEFSERRTHHLNGCKRKLCRHYSSGSRQKIRAIRSSKLTEFAKLRQSGVIRSGRWPKIPRPYASRRDRRCARPLMICELSH
jgi:hypothetical protein